MDRRRDSPVRFLLILWSFQAMRFEERGVIH